MARELETKSGPTAPDAGGKKINIDKFLLMDGLKGLAPEEKIDYYKKLCTHYGLDPITKPFGVFDMNGREDLYIKSTAFDQLCAREKVSRKILQQEVETKTGAVMKKDFVVLGANYDEQYLVKIECSRKVDGELVVVEDVAVVPAWYEKTKWVGSGTNRSKVSAGWGLDDTALMKSITKAYRRGAAKLINLPVMLEDDARAMGDDATIKELNLQTGTPVGGDGAGHPLMMALPAPYLGATNLKELESNKGIEILYKLQKDLKKSKDDGKISEQWAAILERLDTYLASFEK